jgi:hypothetical protein
MRFTKITTFILLSFISINATGMKPDRNNDLINYQVADGRSLKKGIEFLYPFVADKSKWTYPHDVIYWENWPVAHPFLIFGTYEFGVKEWFDILKSLDYFPVVEEVIRNLPIRKPVIWMK